MPPRKSLYPLDWLRVAEQDLVRVERMLDINDFGMTEIEPQRHGGHKA